MEIYSEPKTNRTSLQNEGLGNCRCNDMQTLIEICKQGLGPNMAICQGRRVDGDADARNTGKNEQNRKRQNTSPAKKKKGK